jgi:hypothetical protein
MRRPRFHIGTFLILVVFLGVGFAALRESNELWNSGSFTLTLGILLTSVLLAAHRRESRRAFWSGFALFGWTYLGLSLIPSIESRLLTTKGLAYLDSKTPGRSLGVFTLRLSTSTSGSPNNQVQAVTFTSTGSQLVTSSHGEVRLWDVATGKLLQGWGGTKENFVKIGHSILTMLLAWLGGQLSRSLYAKSRQGNPGSPDTIVPTSSDPGG